MLDFKFFPKKLNRLDLELENWDILVKKSLKESNMWMNIQAFP